MASPRQMVARDLSGFNRTQQSHVSRTGLYDLVNFRPVRGDLVQTDLIGRIPIIIADSPLGWAWTPFNEPPVGTPRSQVMANWTKFEEPLFGDPIDSDMAVWVTFDGQTYGVEVGGNWSNWTGFAGQTYDTAIEADWANWTAFAGQDYGTESDQNMSNWTGADSLG